MWLQVTLSLAYGWGAATQSCPAALLDLKQQASCPSYGLDPAIGPGGCGSIS